MLFFKKEYSVSCQYFRPTWPSSLLGPYHLLGHVLYTTHYQQINFIQALHFPPSEVTAHLPETNFTMAQKTQLNQAS